MLGRLFARPREQMQRKVLRVLIRVASLVIDAAGPSRVRTRLHVMAALLRHEADAGG
ncbi:MAG TPA: hypothetical protein VKK19_15500 [Candidatus Dormibacteraeota bacterium]|nr:hypothetical protein [Candidatus Dormibacteraeota bacterium]